MSARRGERRRYTFDSNAAISCSFERRKPSSSTPFIRQYLANPSSGNEAVVPSGSATVCEARSILTVAPGAASSFAWLAGSSTTGTRPFLSALLRKMSAMRVETTARMPASTSAHGACSRDEPQPKLSPATRIVQPCASGRFRTNSARGFPSAS